MKITEEDLAPHIEDLKRALGDSISVEKIMEELKKYFEYGVNPAEAKKAVVKKLGGDLNTLFVSTPRTLDEVVPTDKNIELKVKILSINPKNVTVQGTEKEIFYGLMADKTTIRPFTAWNDFNLAKNDVVHIKSAYAKDWRGEPQINLGNATNIEPFSDPELESLDTSNLPTSLPSSEYKISDLRDGLSNLTVIGRLLSVESRTVTALGEQKEIYTGIIADGTGKIAFTAWSDFNLKPGEVIKIEGAYIRSWRGVPKINFDDRMEITRLPTDTLPDVEELNLDKITKIGHLQEVGGGMDVTVEGVILDIKEGSGLILRCSECNRVLRNGECMIHGAQDGKPDLRVKSVVDDGSGAIMVILNADITSKILGKNLDECEAEVKDKGPEYLTSIQNELEENLLLSPMRFKGTVTTDDYGAMMICTDIDIPVLSEETQTKVNELLEKINSNNWPPGGI